MEIGGDPIVWHVVQLYAAQGFSEFVLLTGYKGEQIEDFAAADHGPTASTVRCLDTGLDTPTGGRIAEPRERVRRPHVLRDLRRRRRRPRPRRAARVPRRPRRLATMTVVRPELQFGVTEIDGDGRVTGFREKPRAEHWINGGFFFFEPRRLDYLGEASVLEREPLEGLADDGQLRAFRHTGFWDCMDTYKDAVELNDLWAAGEARGRCGR